jgi:hypothetical protein
MCAIPEGPSPDGPEVAAYRRTVQYEFRPVRRRALRITFRHPSLFVNNPAPLLKIPR